MTAPPTIEHNRVPLDSAEMAALWAAYINNTMGTCFLGYFLNHAQDRNIHSLVQEALDISLQFKRDITEIMEKESFPIPHGFQNEDVQTGGPRMFRTPST